MNYIKTDIIFSINVHEKKSFLIKQIENINEHVLVNYIVVINANEYMYNELLDSELIKSNSNIILYKNFLEKKRFHGSLTHGIYLNMKYVVERYQFKYFIVLSSRNMFYNKLTKATLGSFYVKKRTNGISTCETDEEPVFINNGTTYEKLNKNDWHWPSFIKTKLSKYIIKNNFLFQKSAHEGLAFDYITCKAIISFLEDNKDIKTDLFNWDNCVEEFALQTISINQTGYFYHIGGWKLGAMDSISIVNLPKNKFVYKTYRI